MFNQHLTALAHTNSTAVVSTGQCQYCRPGLNVPGQPSGSADDTSAPPGSAQHGCAHPASPCSASNTHFINSSVLCTDPKP